MRWTRRSALALALSLPACGGGDSGPVTLSLASDASQQRSVTTTSAYGDGLGVGDYEGSLIPGPFRALMTFDISPVPAGSTILSAVLQLRQTSVTGDPYTELGDVVVDHVDYGTGYPDSTDFSGSTLTSDIGVLSSDGLLEVKTLEVASAVQADVDFGSTRSQFRLRFSALDASGDAAVDVVNFEDALNLSGTGIVPVLVVTYD